MTNEATIQEVLEQFDRIVSKPVTTYLENKERWGEFNFQEVEYEIRALYGLVGCLAKLPIAYLPPVIYDFTKSANDLCGLFGKIESFSVVDVSEDGKQGIIDTIRDKYTEIFSYYSVFLPILYIVGVGEELSLSEMKNQTALAEKMCNDMSVYISDKKKEVEITTEAIRKIVAEQGVNRHTRDFSKEVEKLSKVGRNWLWITGVLAGVSLTASIASIFVNVGDLTEPFDLIQLTVSKVVALSLLFGSTIWCGKNYRAIKHQEAVNQHRANALSTFQAFVEASGDPSTKEAVLLETTRSIFAQASSGYLSNSDTMNADNLKVIEMVKRISGGS